MHHKMLRKMLKCVLLLYLNCTHIMARDLYVKQRDWRWTEHADQSDFLDRSIERSHVRKQLWSWKETPDNNLVGLKELFRNEQNPGNLPNSNPGREDNLKRTPFHIISVQTPTKKPRDKLKRPRKQYVPFNSMTLNQLYKKDSKDKPDELRNPAVQKPSAPTKLPWWANFEKKGNKKTQTTTIKETTTETYKPVSSYTVRSQPKDEITGNRVRTTTPASLDIPYSSSAVFQNELSTNTIGKLLNVSGSVPTRLMNGLLVPDSSLGRIQSGIIQDGENSELTRNGEALESIKSSIEKVLTEAKKQEDVDKVEYATFGWVEDDLSTSPSITQTTVQPITRPSTNRTEISWINWLASKSKLTTQKPTTTTRFRSNEAEDPFQELLLDKLKIPGPPIMLPTPQATTTTSTNPPPTTSKEVVVWTWWTPATDDKPSTSQQLPSDDRQQQAWEQNKISLEEKIMDEVINKETTEKMTTASYTSEKTDSDNLKNESPGHSGESDTETIQVSQEHNSNKVENEKAETTSEPVTDDVKQNDLEDKYLELVAHNTRLVDVLRSTLELQAELFRRIVRYLFP
eukprot:TRINITY_DN20690_c0_g1_i1.p1 TRINITY_DN20690_c0_g1~~TRINITY_DN20690_c0_g1_i1.p1  ORF type:complete len:571 (+),score=120.58 TRINITY_DN20690_c0_g1_i1:118-1830(+)